MSRTSVLAVAVLLLTAAVPGGVGLASGDSFVSVSVDVEPEQPTVEESFSLVANVTNADDSDTTYRITDATVREGQSSDSEEVSTAEPSVRVDPGETRRVGVDVTINETGTRTLFVHLRLRDNSGNTRTVVHPVTVTVRQSHPQVAVSAESAAPGDPRPLTVTVSNGNDEQLRNVEVSVRGEQLSIADDRRVTARITASSNQEFSFSATPAEERTLPVTVRVQYTLDGERRTVERTLTADFSPTNGSSDRPQLGVSVQEAVPGAERQVNVTVANGLTNQIRQLRLIVSSANETVTFRSSERVRSALAAGDQTTFRLPARATQAGRYPVTVTLVYTDEGTRKRVSRTFTGDFTGPQSPGTIALSNVQATLAGGEIRIDATAGNPGTTDVGGVTVAVGDTDGVESADYFIGRIEGSDGLQSFTLTVSASANVTSLPLRVSYVIDGVQKSYTTEIDVQRAIQTPPPGANSDGGGGPPLLLVGGGVIALLVVILLVRRFR